jgi:hypothetical protein
VVAVIVLHTSEDGKLASRPKVDLKKTDAVDDVIVDALRVAAGLIQARLPAPLEDIARITGVGNPLSLGRARH